MNCSIARVSTFDRKHYFYADQPVLFVDNFKNFSFKAGYQITQYYHPIAVNGNIEFYVYDYQLHPMPLLKTCRIARLQIEQDTGKTLTDEEGGRVLIDLNRCGVGLMEIVTEHDIQSGLEASCLVKELQALLIAIGSCHGRMERGELRVDANVSVKKQHETELRTRTEVKNLNSLRFIRKAIDFEIARHIECYESGNFMTNETRSFDFKSGETVPMRDKEVRQDYRYLPEPNLPPLRLYDECNAPPANLPSDQCIFIDKLRLDMPPLPHIQRKRWGAFGLPESCLCQILIRNDGYFFKDVPKLRSYYAYCVDDCGLDPHGCAEILLNDLPRALKRKRQDLKRWYAEKSLPYPLGPLNSSDIFTLVKARLEGTISAESFRKVCSAIGTSCRVVRILQDGRDHRSADMLIKDLNLISISDMQTIERTCKEVLAAEQKTLEDYKKGKTIAMKHLLRIASKQLDQRVDMMKLREVFERLINGS
ncbi:glutamyl tRNA(Gln) amidotransferase [Trichuris trichiura]|uniref:Glutamyl tRNA(Gln) amidotransferase n=1 Tax=Trichuris trichiura TaxID=36087 RepID=A0A077ZMW6_TRITR|nr:glutamyl tRNA(Gln) amidotransferase [Trichuris trichiura]